MSKMTRKEKQAEERRIIAEMDGALQGNKGAQPIEDQADNRGYDETMPDKIHCRRCKTLMEKGVCPTCGFRIYVPMDKKKREKMKLTLAILFMAVFLAVFIWTQVKG